MGENPTSITETNPFRTNEIAIALGGSSQDLAAKIVGI